MQISSAVSPYLHAALTILQTLERETRARSIRPGSKEELAANALRTRGMELSAQIARLEMEARSTALENRLHGSDRPSRPSTGALRPASGPSSAREQSSTLRAQLAKAENDAKAYKSRLRATEGLERAKLELTERVADLERQLIARDGALASHGTELEEMRRRAVVAEATADALREELKQDVASKAEQRHNELGLTRRLSELEAQLQHAQLDRATMERKAEVCEAELVETLAKLYTLERASGGGPAALDERAFVQVDECLHTALENARAGTVEQHQWRASDWMGTIGLDRLVSELLLRQLRVRVEASEWLERSFLAALGSKGGRGLVRSLLLEASVVDRLSDRLWQVRLTEARGLECRRFEARCDRVQHAAWRPDARMSLLPRLRGMGWRRRVAPHAYARGV